MSSTSGPLVCSHGRGHDVVFSDARSEQKLKGLVLDHWSWIEQELGLVLDRFCAR